MALGLNWNHMWITADVFMFFLNLFPNVYIFMADLYWTIYDTSEGRTTKSEQLVSSMRKCTMSYALDGMRYDNYKAA